MEGKHRHSTLSTSTSSSTSTSTSTVIHEKGSELELIRHKGTLALVGSRIDNIGKKWSSLLLERHTKTSTSTDHSKYEPLVKAMHQQQERDIDHYHITICSPEEMALVEASNITIPAALIIKDASKELCRAENDLRLIEMGVGKCEMNGNTCYFVIIFSQALQKLRKSLLGANMKPKDIHITLGFSAKDIHGVSKGMDSLLMQTEGCSFLPALEDEEIFARNTEEVLRTFPGQLMKRNCAKIIDIMQERDYLFAAYYSARNLFIELGHTRPSFDLLEQYLERRSMVCRCLNSDKLVDFEGNPIDYGKLVCDALNNNLFASNPAYHMKRRYYSSTKFVKDSFTFYTFKFSETPRNFSFVAKNLAGASIPKKQCYFDAFLEMGITDVVTLMEDPLEIGNANSSRIKYHWFAVDDQRPPTTEQMIEIIKIFAREGSKVLIHCLGGVGRTATALCACLMYERAPLMSPLEAKAILAHRKTILHATQELFLDDWYSYCSDKATAKLNDLKVVSTECSASSASGGGGPKAGGGSVSSTGSTCNKKDLPPLIMCVGLPSSGKSTFSQTLCNWYSSSSSSSSPVMHRINQDEQGRRECEGQIGMLVKQRGNTVVLDRCNLTKVERKEWLDLAHNSKAWVIFFDVPEEECRWRIVRRQGHPTLRAGSGSKVISAVANKMEAPTPEEGFEKMHIVRSFEDSNALLRLFGCEAIPVSTIPESEMEGLIKFPRTRHLTNLGSATRDDLVMSENEVRSCFLNRPLYIEEKIDGANMGISIKDGKLCAQNRSHFVTSTYHPQFKFLDKWILLHSDELWEVLECSDRYILYGEWVYAKHSIHYKDLPDWFVVFDMYDKLEGKFFSRRRLEARLAGTSLFIIPCIRHDSFSSLDQLRALVNTKSEFYDGPVEGVYVRSCATTGSGEWLLERGKMVRPDFLSGDEHWTKGGLTPNTKVKDTGAGGGDKCDRYSIVAYKYKQLRINPSPAFFFRLISASISLMDPMEDSKSRLVTRTRMKKTGTIFEEDSRLIAANLISMIGNDCNIRRNGVRVEL